MLKKITFIAVVFFMCSISGCSKKVDLPDAGVGECPAGMVDVIGRFCMDAHEYPNAAGEYPLVNVDWKTAAGICESEGKRLCSNDEWVYACGGGEGGKFPYGDKFSSVCNINTSYDDPAGGDKKKKKKKSGDDTNPLRDVLIPAEQIHGMKTIIEGDGSPAAFLVLTGFTENNVLLLQTFHLYLTAQDRYAKASDIKAFAADKKGYGPETLEYYLQSLGAPAELSESQKALLGKDEKTAPLPGKENYSLKDYKSALEKVFDLEKKAYFSTKDGRGDEKNEVSFDEIGGLLDALRAKIATSILESSPKLLKKISDIDFNVFKSQSQSVGEDIYDKVILELENDDLSELKNDIIPGFRTEGADAFGDYIYALQRKIVIEYKAKNKQFKFKRADLPAGTNVNCKTAQDVYDMVGNVWEWVGGSESDANYRGGDSSDSSGSNFKNCSPYFGGLKIRQPDHRSPSVGFRCCK